MALEVLVDKRPTSFAIAVNDNPILFDGSKDQDTLSSPIALEFAVRESSLEKRAAIQPGGARRRSPPPLPPKGIRPFAAADDTSTASSSPNTELHYTLALSPNQEKTEDSKAMFSSRHHSPTPSPPSSRRIVTSSPFPNNSPRHHPSRSSPKPIPPPRASRRLNKPSSKSVPNLSAIPFEQRNDSGSKNGPFNFLDSTAGEECGRFSVDYLGNREIDQFVGVVDECAQQLMNCKPPVRANQVVAYVSTERIRLAPPKAGPLFKSFAVQSIMSVAQCHKNKRIVGIVMWKARTTPVCHLLRSSDQLISNNLLEALRHVVENLDIQSLMQIDRPEVRAKCHSISSNSSTDSDHLTSPPPPAEGRHSMSAVHIGCIKAGKIHTIAELIQRVLAECQPSHTREVSVWLSESQVQLVDMTYQWEFIYAMHDTSRICAIGVYPDDKKFIGYFVQEKDKPLMGHVLWCSTAGTAASMLSYLKHACHLSFSDRRDDSAFVEETDGFGGGKLSHSQPSEPRSIISRLRSLTSTSSQSDCHSPTHSSFHSYMGSPKSPYIFDCSRKRKDTVVVPTAFSGMELGEEDYVRFSVNYVGSATLDPPFVPHSITRAMQMFNQNGVAAGMAAVPKNTVSMHISALGINLSDKKHKLFVSRNYPRKKIVGYCVHKMDKHYFGVATLRPGFDDLKVHVFMQVSEPVTQIMDGIKFWLQMDPLT